MALSKILGGINQMYKDTLKTRKRLSVSLPKDLARRTRERAKRDNVPISYIVEEALKLQIKVGDENERDT